MRLVAADAKALSVVGYTISVLREKRDCRVLAYGEENRKNIWDVLAQP